MVTWIFVIAALITAAAVMLLKSRAAGTGFVRGGQLSQLWKQPQRPNHTPAVARRDFRAVSIKCGPDACKAARVLEGKRGFPNQIPRLPLSQCDAGHCACAYKQHADRRENDDRRRLFATFSGVEQDATERRAVSDRRHDPATEELHEFNFSASKPR